MEPTYKGIQLREGGCERALIKTRFPLDVAMPSLTLQSTFRLQWIMTGTSYIF